MKKFDNKGFALVETLIVSVFVVSLFLIVFNNFYPLMSEYEKREVYDDVDGVYAAYWVKRLVEDSNLDINTHLSNYTTYGQPIDLNNFCSNSFTSNSSLSLQCTKLFSNYNVEYFYVTPYNILDFKTNVDKSNPDFEDYLNFLPDYSKSQNNTYSANFRVIVGMKRQYKDIDGHFHEYMAYSNMEGNK